MVGTIRLSRLVRWFHWPYPFFSLLGVFPHSADDPPTKRRKTLLATQSSPMLGTALCGRGLSGLF